MTFLLGVHSPPIVAGRGGRWLAQKWISIRTFLKFISARISSARQNYSML